MGRKSDTDTWDSMASDLQAKAIELIPQIITAGFKGPSDEEPAVLYVRYLKSLEPLQRRIASDEFVKACEKSLHESISGNASFAGVVDRYQQATHDMLVWRSRTADQLAGKRKATFIPISQSVHAATASSEGYRGLTENSRQNDLRLRDTSTFTLRKPVSTLLGKAGSVNNLIRMPGNGRFSMSTGDNFTYAIVPAGIKFENQLAALRADLLVDASHPPLSTSATGALASGTRVDLKSAGGVIKAITLHGYISRIASIPNSDLYLFPGKTIQSHQDGRTPGLDSVLTRIDLLPSWVQGDAFFADLSK